MPLDLAAIAADELRAARSAADKQGQNLAGVLPTLPPTEALARLLSIFFAIFGDINDETTDALMRSSSSTTSPLGFRFRRLLAPIGSFALTTTLSSRTQVLAALRP
jgi:hypothetical protein